MKDIIVKRGHFTKDKVRGVTLLMTYRYLLRENDCRDYTERLYILHLPRKNGSRNL